MLCSASELKAPFLVLWKYSVLCEYEEEIIPFFKKNLHPIGKVNLFYTKKSEKKYWISETYSSSDKEILLWV